MERVRINTIIEIAGFPKEHIEKTMDDVVDKIKGTKEIKFIKGKVAEVKEIEKMFSTFSDLELEFDNIINLMSFCFDYMPSSIEILEPENLSLKSDEFSEITNDIMAKLHQWDMAIKNLVIENKNLKNKLEKESKSS